FSNGYCRRIPVSGRSAGVSPGWGTLEDGNPSSQATPDEFADSIHCDSRPYPGPAPGRQGPALAPGVVAIESLSSRSEGDPKEGNRSTRTELVSNRSSAELAETAVHDVRPEDVLAPAGHGRPLVQQLVLEDQRQAPPRRDRPFLDHRLAAGEPLIE